MDFAAIKFEHGVTVFEGFECFSPFTCLLSLFFPFFLLSFYVFHVLRPCYSKLKNKTD